jgi:hypothetical protein
MNVAVAKLVTIPQGPGDQPQEPIAVLGVLLA